MLVKRKKDKFFHKKQFIELTHILEEEMIEAN